MESGERLERTRELWCGCSVERTTETRAVTATTVLGRARLQRHGGTCWRWQPKLCVRDVARRAHHSPSLLTRVVDDPPGCRRQRGWLGHSSHLRGRSLDGGLGDERRLSRAAPRRAGAPLA